MTTRAHPATWTRAARGLAAGLLALCGMAGLLAYAPDAAAQPAAEVPDARQVAREERMRMRMRVWRRDEWLARADAAAIGEVAWSDDPKLLALGRQLYLQGQREDGRPLEGLRLEGQVRITGPAAACVMCHRRSGLGAVEGTSQIPPISGRYLFDQDARALVNQNLRTRKAFNLRHEPYTLAALGRALREGRHVAGHTFDPLMPRYELTDREVLALASHLRRLSNTWSTGVEDKHVRLATIVTPDVDGHRKQIFLDTLRAIVAQKNGNIVPGQRSMSSGAEMVLQTDRHWELHVWELHGAADTWRAQLQQLQARDRVFAVVSGLGGTQWQPVHRFCEEQAMPCWFPSVAAPPADGAPGFYNLYFSAGVALEADVLAQQLATRPAEGQVLQLVAAAEAADGPAARLARALAQRGRGQRTLVVGDGGPALTRALASAGAADTVIAWLPARQLAALGKVAPPSAPVFASATLAGDLAALPVAWRGTTRVVYPYELPQARQRALTYFREWLRIRKMPLQDEVLQSEVFFAASYFNDTLVDMLDNVHRDHLVERGENMLSLRELAKAEDEARELSLPRTNLVDPNRPMLRTMSQRAMIPRAVPNARQPMSAARVDPRVPDGAAAARHDGPDDAAPDAAGTGTAEGTTVYPRLSLGPGQRFASKGAYLVRVGDDPQHPELRAEGEWIVP